MNILSKFVSAGFWTSFLIIVLSGEERKISGCRLFCLSLLASPFVPEDPESSGKSTDSLTLLA